MEEKRRGNSETEQGGIGRRNFLDEDSSNKEERNNAKNITLTDFQEGNMEHGETGGEKDITSSDSTNDQEEKK